MAWIEHDYADSDALIVLGEGEMTLEAGSLVDVLPY